MKHLTTIRALIETLMKSGSFHALVLQSPPGWGKSTAIDSALQALKIKGIFAGSYATPLHIYNTLGKHPKKLIVFDDCAGLFSDTKSMSVLKAATWPSGGGTKSKKKDSRCVSWGSTSDKVERPFVDFSGKLILLTNTLPAGKETDAFLSRCLSYRLSFDKAEIRRLLLISAQSEEFFPDSKISLSVARYLTNSKLDLDLYKINLRTLKMGYELATLHPDSWRDLIRHLLPLKKPVESRTADIFQEGVPAKMQEARFMETTGKSRRSYYNYKRKLGLTRSYACR